MSGLASRRDSLRAQFDELTRGLRTPSGEYSVSSARWRRIVAWLFERFIDILMSAPRLFWGRLDGSERTTLRDFSKRLGLAPKEVAADTPSATRGEIIRIVRKGLGLRV
jgi:hypothetical protein